MLAWPLLLLFVSAVPLCIEAVRISFHVALPWGTRGNSLKFSHCLAPSCVPVPTIVIRSSHLQVGLVGKETVGSEALWEQR